MQRRARLPAGATSVEIPVYSAGRDFTADGDAEMAVGLAYPTDRVWTNNGCLPYTIGEVDSEVTFSDSSKPIPQNCKTNVRFEVDRQHFSMAEGDTVNYSIYLSGPEPTPASFPIVILWQIEESKDYNTILARAGTGGYGAGYGASYGTPSSHAREQAKVTSSSPPKTGSGVTASR